MIRFLARNPFSVPAPATAAAAAAALVVVALLLLSAASLFSPSSSSSPHLPRFHAAAAASASSLLRGVSASPALRRPVDAVALLTLPPLPPPPMAATATSAAVHAFAAPAGGLPYLLSLPPPPAAGAACGSAPLVLFLHGAGESGEEPWGLLPGYDPQAGRWAAALPHPVRRTPPGLALDGSALARGYGVLAPVTDRGWGAPAIQASVIALLDAVLASPAARAACIDARRVVLTGISMGGAGAWALGAAYPGRFAGVSPICGYVNGGGEAEVAAALAGKPVFAAHGTNDVVIPEAASRRVVEHLRAAEAAAAGAAAGSSVIYRTFVADAPAGAPDMEGHDSFSKVYSSREWWAWAGEQRLAE
jgi:predicted esterase